MQKYAVVSPTATDKVCPTLAVHPLSEFMLMVCELVLAFRKRIAT